jgi:hypothetical protein
MHGLSDLPSFRLPVPHLGQDNMARNNNMPYLWNSNYLEKCGECLSHNSSILGLGEPMHAIRVIKEKQLLLIMVGANIILSFGKEYIKLVWEFICKPGREN